MKLTKIVASGFALAAGTLLISLPARAQSVTVSPTSLTFRVYRGIPISKGVTITNNGPGTLTISSIWLVGDDFSISGDGCGSSLGPGDECGVIVTFNPGDVCLGEAEFGTLYFLDSAGQQSVSLSGNNFDCQPLVTSLWVGRFKYAPDQAGEGVVAKTALRLGSRFRASYRTQS